MKISRLMIFACSFILFWLLFGINDTFACDHCNNKPVGSRWCVYGDNPSGIYGYWEYECKSATGACGTTARGENCEIPGYIIYGSAKYAQDGSCDTSCNGIQKNGFICGAVWVNWNQDKYSSYVGACCSPTAPGNPSNLSSSPIGVFNTSGDVNLRWNAPSSWGEECGSTNRFYNVDVKLKSSSTWDENSGCKNPTSVSCNAISLSTCTEYDWRVRSNNSKLPSDWVYGSFKTPCPPEINTVQISNDGINFHNHCGNNNTQLSCEANPMCIWNSVKTRCQAYLTNEATGNNGRIFSSFKNNDKLFVKSHITDPDGYSDLASIGFYLDSQDTSQPSRPLLASVSRSRYDNGMLLLKNIYGDGRWALRGIGYIGTSPNDYACNCGLESGLTKNCDGSSDSTSGCSTKDISSCNGNCGWNYTYGYCQPTNADGGCKDNYIIHPWRIGVEMTNSNYWNTGIIGAGGSNYTICSLGGAGGQIDSAVNGECTTGGISGRVTSQTLSSNGYITNRYKSVSNDSVKLYFRIHALDKFAVREKNNFGNWTMIGGPEGGTCAWSGASSVWSCGMSGPLNMYVDNSVPGGSISVSTGGLAQGSIKLLFKDVSDTVIGGDGGGLRGGFSPYEANGSKGIDNLRVNINSTGLININASGLTITSNTCDSLSAGTLLFNCYVIVNGLSGGSDYKFNANVTDLAGNSREISTGFDYAGPWFETVSGDLYSGGPVTNSVPTFVPPRFTSTYLLYSGQVITGATSSKNWLLNSYNDANGDIDWYTSLSKLAEANTGTKFEDFPAIAFGNFGDSIDSVYKNVSDLTTGSTIITCSGRKVIFVGNNLNINANINVIGPNSGCLFIVNGDLVIEGAVTELYAGFIVKGNVIIKNSYNTLTINGLLFSTGQVKFDTKDTSCGGKCGRDLFVTDNLLSPSERFVYDPRYVDIMREFLGRKKIENFTCGTVDREECGY